MNQGRRLRPGGAIRTTPRRFAVALVAVAALIVASCSWQDPFPEYRGINLIEQRGFDVDSFYADSMTDPGTAFEYVRVSAVGDFGATTGLDPGVTATIRRLEAINLFPDGDFELSAPGSSPPDPNGAADPPPYWDIDPAPAPPNLAPTNFTVVDSGGIQGNSVRYEFITGDQSAALDLDAHALDGFIQPAVYFLSLQFRRDLPQRVITFDYGSATDQTWLDNQRWEIVARSDGTTPVETLPTPGDELLNKITVFAASATASNYFYIGSPKADTPGQGGWVDNIRLGRLDTVPHAALAIPATGANGSLPLVAGAYRFSVFVKSEVDDQVTPAPAGANRFRAGQIVLGMNDDLELVARSEGGWSTDEWTLVSAVFHLEASELDSTTLRLTVIHPESPVIGSVLIAAPTLELVSGDGSE